MELTPEILSFELHYAIVARHPRILLIGMGTPQPGFAKFAGGRSSMEVLCQILGPGGHLLISPWYYMAGPSAWQDRLSSVAKSARAFPETRVTFLCNAPEEIPVVEEHGLDAIFISQNAFVQEQLFDIAAEPKQYRAIYVAQLAAVKRHELAAKVAELALIYAPWNSDNYGRLRSLLAGAAFLNGDPASERYRFFDSGTVAHYIDQARVGLCLSAEEGAMWASMEYLLCGVPVVSTPSRGGRDVFFDPEYCMIVPPDPDAVAAAVTELIERSIDPAIVRARTVTKIAGHRQRLVDFVDRAQIAAGEQPTGRDELRRLLRSRWHWYSYGTIADIVRGLAQ
ncbi:MAG TPA: glycosyltransferase [Stellaceae bacterium]|nr:glycosyltransferase [Stellaceae bacterium]